MEPALKKSRIQEEKKDDQAAEPLSEDMKKCDQILTSLLKRNHANIFAVPVDPVELNIPTYPHLISQPMDLGTVKKKLEQGAYPHPEAFATEVRLIWANATTFNAPENFVYTQAVLFAEAFEKKLKQRKLCDRGLTGAVPGKEKENDSESIAAAKRWASSVEGTKDLTRAEKRTMKKSIMDILNQNMEATDPFVEFIKQEAPETEQGDKLVVDLNKLKAPTLRLLQAEIVKVIANTGIKPRSRKR